MKDSVGRADVSRLVPASRTISYDSMVSRRSRRARGPDSAREALGQLLTRYLPALRDHLVCSKRLLRMEADDVVQDFVRPRSWNET